MNFSLLKQSKKTILGLDDLPILKHFLCMYLNKTVAYFGFVVTYIDTNTTKRYIKKNISVIGLTLKLFWTLLNRYL